MDGIKKEQIKQMHLFILYFSAFKNKMALLKACQQWKLISNIKLICFGCVWNDHKTVCLIFKIK